MQGLRQASMHLATCFGHTMAAEHGRTHTACWLRWLPLSPTFDTRMLPRFHRELVWLSATNLPSSTSCARDNNIGVCKLSYVLQVL